MSNAYVVIEALAGPQQLPIWGNAFFRSLVTACESKYSTNVVEERMTAGSNSAVSVTLKVMGEDAYESLASEKSLTSSANDAGLQVCVFKEACSVPLLPSDVEVTFYRLDQPNSRMVFQTECNAQAIHIPTGITARSEQFHSMAANQTEALTLLKSKLNALSKR